MKKILQYGTGWLVFPLLLLVPLCYFGFPTFVLWLICSLLGFDITTNQYFVIPLLLGAYVMYRYRPLADTVLGFVETVINLYD